MALDDDIRILSGVRLFEGFTQEQLRLLAFGAESHDSCRRAGSSTARTTTADSAYIVVARHASGSSASTRASAFDIGMAGAGSCSAKWR